jgi:hypothetical protein
MKKVVLICLILIVQIGYGQENFQFKKINQNEILIIEEENKGLIRDTVEFGLSLNNFGTSIMTKTRAYIFERVEDDFSPKLHVWYHIDSMNNDLVAVTYNWDFYNPGFSPDKNRELLIATNKRESEYQQKYNALNTLLKIIFDSPKEVNLISDNDNSFNEMTCYENEEMYAYSRIRFQRTIKEHPMIGLANNHFVVQMVISYK